jgi:hypothetical protein
MNSSGERSLTTRGARFRMLVFYSQAVLIIRFNSVLYKVVHNNDNVKNLVLSLLIIPLVWYLLAVARLASM